MVKTIQPCKGSLHFDMILFVYIMSTNEARAVLPLDMGEPVLQNKTGLLVISGQVRNRFSSQPKEKRT